MHRLQRMTPLALALLLAGPTALAGFPGRPALLSAEGGHTNAAWVAYDNGEVLRCSAETGDCRVMSGLPTFAIPVVLDAEPDFPAAWIGWSDGSLYRCNAAGTCTSFSIPGDSGGPRPR